MQASRPADCIPPLPSSCQALPCGNFGHSNSVWLRRFAVPRRAALMRIMRIMRIMRFVVGAPYALHYPAVTHCPEQDQTPASKPTGYNETLHLCQAGQTSQTGQTKASRHRNTHTSVIRQSPVKNNLPGDCAR